MKDVSVAVHDGVAVIKGICNDSLCMANCENLALHVAGVKSVINNLTKAAEPIQPSIIYKPDDTLMAAVKHALKGFETVQAEVNNGVISLDGEIGEKRNDGHALFVSLRCGDIAQTKYKAQAHSYVPWLRRAYEGRRLQADHVSNGLADVTYRCETCQMTTVRTLRQDDHPKAKS